VTIDPFSAFKLKPERAGAIAGARECLLRAVPQSTVSCPYCVDHEKAAS
jgi:hypothetical protein